MRDHRNYISSRPSLAYNNFKLITPVIFTCNSTGEIAVDLSTLNLDDYKYYYLNYAYANSDGIDTDYLSNIAYSGEKDLLDGTSGCVLLGTKTEVDDLTIRIVSGYKRVSIFGSDSLLPPNSPPRAYYGSSYNFTPIDCTFEYSGTKKYVEEDYTPADISEL